MRVRIIAPEAGALYMRGFRGNYMSEIIALIERAAGIKYFLVWRREKQQIIKTKYTEEGGK